MLSFVLFLRRKGGGGGSEVDIVNLSVLSAVDDGVRVDGLNALQLAFKVCGIAVYFFIFFFCSFIGLVQWKRVSLESRYRHRKSGERE